MSDRTIVVSATNLLARGFLVVPTDRRSPAGVPVNGLYAVARAIQHTVTWKVPARAVAIIDLAGRQWPELLEPQLPLLKPLLESLGFDVVESTNEPSLVASYAQAALQRGDDVVVVGVDKRYAQLVGDSLWWYDANKDARYTPEIVRKRFGVGPGQVADWLALVGDDDQLPGIAGIGAKGATTLLEQYATVDEALAHLDAIEGRVGKALTAAGDGVGTELQRARLNRSLPLPRPLNECVWRAPAAAALNAQFESLGFSELLVDGGARMAVTVCTEAEALAPYLTPIDGEAIALYALLEDPAPVRQTLFGLAVSRGDDAGCFVTAGSAAWPALVAWLQDQAAPKCGHDVVGTIVALKLLGIELKGIRSDCACASHLTEPSGWAPHELGVVAKYVLGRSLPDDDSVRGVGRERKPWSQLPLERAARTAVERANATAQLCAKLVPTVDAKLLAEYLALTDTVVRMELHGIAIDQSQLQRAQTAFARIEEELQVEIDKLAGHTFNINSSAQLGQVLFEELKLPVVSRTKTGYSTANEALERIEHAHPIVALVLRWRGLRRLRDNWLKALVHCIDSDGRVHSRFHPARSFSGQLINTNPDLGRVPGRTPEMAEVRRAFVAGEGKLLMSVDFSQLGLHVLAHLSDDEALLEPLSKGADLHRLTAAAVLEKAPEALSYDERQLGKVVNFATFAGQGPSALALQLGISAAEAKEYIARFYRRYAKVRAFQDEQLHLVATRGYLTTIAGRHWPIGGLSSLDSQLRSYAERLARRGTHEGSVADVSRRGLLEADRALRQAGLRTVPVLQVHDEVLFEVPEDELHAAAQVCAKAMREAFVLKAPLKVGVEAGPNWADMKPVALP